MEKKKEAAAINQEETTIPGKSADLLGEHRESTSNSLEDIINELADYAIIRLDPQGTILSWNKGAENIKGYTEKEILGKNYRIFYTGEDKAKNLSKKLLAETKEAGRTNYEGWRVRKNGTRFWGSMTLTALHNKAGDLTGFLKVTRDLTEKKVNEDRVNNLLEELSQTNQSLKASEERYHKMISEVRDYAIILLDPQGIIQKWNSGAEHIKGYRASEIVGRSFRIFYSEHDQADGLPDRLLAEAASEGKVSHEGWRVKKDGSWFWGNVVITALHDDEGDIIGFSKVTRDLTAKKVAEDALKQNAAQLDSKTKALERLNEELSSFTYVASHDLKEPLRKIKIFASRLKEPETGDRMHEFIEKIIKSASKMQSLIDNLLTYSQMSNGSAHYREIDLNQVVDSVVSDLEIAIAEKHAQITVGKLPSIKGIGFQLHQLFLNLIFNSLKFGKDEEAPRIKVSARLVKGPEVQVFASEVSRYHHITVSDNGIGFPPEQADRVFEAFYRLSSKGPISGSGIGLAIVKKIVENHHGVVTAESSPGKGAIFHIYLPE